MLYFRYLTWGVIKSWTFFLNKISELFLRKKIENFFSEKTPKLYLSEIETFSEKTSKIFPEKDRKFFSGKNQELQWNNWFLSLYVPNFLVLVLPLWLTQIHLPTHSCHVLVRLPHKRILNGIWRQGRKPNISTHAGTNLH